MTRKIIIGLSAMSIGLLIMLIFISLKSTIKAYEKEQTSYFDYHFQLIVDKEVDKKTIEEMIDGCEKASLENNVFVEVIEAIDNESKLELIDKAIYSKVDGIGYSAEYNEKLEELVQKAKAVDIPIVNYAMEEKGLGEIFSIHLSSKKIGEIVATNIVGNIKGLKLKNKKILVFLKECDEKDRYINNGIIKGFKKGIWSKYKNNVEFIRVDAQGYDVNSKLKSKIKKYKNVAMAVCFDEEYTSAVSAIYLKEKKRNVQVIGYGNTYNNQEALKLGNLELLFNVDNSSLSYNTIKALFDMKKNISIKQGEYAPIFSMYKLDSSKKVIESKYLVK